MANFPVQVQQDDAVTPSDIDAYTAVTLYADGRVVVNTNAHEWTDLHGGHVGLVVLLYQDGSPPFWLTSDPVRYGLDGKWVGTSQITTSFTQTVDPDTMRRVAYVAIKHYDAPNDAFTDVQAWLNGAQQSFNAVATIAKDIRSLTS